MSTRICDRSYRFSDTHLSPSRFIFISALINQTVDYTRWKYFSCHFSTSNLNPPKINSSSCPINYPFTKIKILYFLRISQFSFHRFVSFESVSIRFYFKSSPLKCTKRRNSRCRQTSNFVNWNVKCSIFVFSHSKIVFLHLYFRFNSIVSVALFFDSLTSTFQGGTFERIPSSSQN